MKIENTRRNFIPRNDGFICTHCGTTVPPARGTFRNHCPQCLTSKHVDHAIPGDRASTCQSPMPCIRFEGTDPDKLTLIHECRRCEKISRNRTAPDDRIEQLY